MMRPTRIVTTLATLALCASCVGTAGGDIVSFPAFAAGPAEANGGPLVFANGRGWTVTLRRARMHVGAVYLNRSVPVSGGQQRECFLPGVYVAQVLEGVDVDALSPGLQPFSARGFGTTDLAVTGEVWLTGGPIDAPDDRTSIVDVEGTATKGSDGFRFEATITIGRNRSPGATDPARPGANPLCAERIVTPIPTSVTPQASGALVLRIDPKGWFANVDFADLAPVSAGTDLRRFPDASEGQAATNLYRGVRASTGVYRFEWQP